MTLGRELMIGRILTDHAEFHPVDAASSVRNEGEADGGANYTVGGGDRQSQQGGSHQPHARSCGSEVKRSETTDHWQ